MRRSSKGSTLPPLSPSVKLRKLIEERYPPNAEESSDKPAVKADKVPDEIPNGAGENPARPAHSVQELRQVFSALETPEEEKESTWFRRGDWLLFLGHSGSQQPKFWIPAFCLSDDIQRNENKTQINKKKDYYGEYRSKGSDNTKQKIHEAVC